MRANAFLCRNLNAGIRTRMARSNNLYLLIGALVVIVAGLSFYVYREETKPEGVSISIGENGVQVQEE